MFISKIEVYKLSIPMEPFVIATGTMDYAQNIFLKIYLDNGLYGVGECSAFPMIVGETQNTCFEVAKDFATIWKGENPLEIDKRIEELNTYIARNSTIKSAFDMALYDLNAKIENIPLYRFLSGNKRKVITDITLGIGEAREMAEKAKKLVKDGAKILKVKLGEKAEDDIDRIAKIRESIGYGIPIRIDANQGWTYSEAVEALQKLEPYRIEFCEQPLRTHEDYKLSKLRNQTTIAIMADESVYDHHDAKRLCRNNSCDYINIKLSKSGGIHEAIKIHKIAQEYGIKCMIGGMLESRLGLAAKLHMAYALPGVQFFDLDTCMVGHLENPVNGGVYYKNYEVFISEGIGIAADIKPEYLEKYESWVLR